MSDDAVSQQMHEAVLRAAARVRGSDPDDVREGAVVQLGIATRAAMRAGATPADVEALPELAGGVQAVTALHAPEPDITCRCCREPWPCSTVRVMCAVIPGMRANVAQLQRHIASRLS